MKNQELDYRTETITPQLAEKYLKLNISNRPLIKRTVNYYAEEMSQGKWVLNGETICFDKNGYLRDGQHRLRAVIKSGVTIKSAVARNCPEEAFATYDTGRARRASDVLSMSQVNNATNIASLITKYMGLKMGLSVMTNVSRKTTINLTNKDILDEYNEKQSFYNKVYAFSDSCYDYLRVLSKSEIGSVYAYLVQEKGYKEEYVEMFFKALIFNTDVDNKTISLLQRKLVNDKMTSKRMTGKYRTAIIIKTWNCFVTHKNLKVLSWDEEREGKLSFL